MKVDTTIPPWNVLDLIKQSTEVQLFDTPEDSSFTVDRPFLSPNGLPDQPGCIVNGRLG